MRCVVYCDGACRRNGKSDAEAEGSFAVYDVGRHAAITPELHERLRTEKPLHFEHRFAVVADRPTNNLAEATALEAALRWCKANGLINNNNEIHICMDSQLVLSQFLGVYQTRSPALRAVYQRIYAMLGKENERAIHLHWIRGEVMKASILAH